MRYCKSMMQNLWNSYISSIYIARIHLRHIITQYSLQKNYKITHTRFLYKNHIRFLFNREYLRLTQSCGKSSVQKRSF